MRRIVCRAPWSAVAVTEHVLTITTSAASVVAGSAPRARNCSSRWSESAWFTRQPNVTIEYFIFFNHCASFAAAASTLSASFFLYATTLSAIDRSPTARICAASTPAFVAPGLPIETVATGTPGGICTVESSASSPLSADESIGTPMTGSVECAATTPARCAAAPAPTINTFTPRPGASDTSRITRSGDRCAEATVISHGI